MGARPKNPSACTDADASLLSRVENSLERLGHWIEANGYRAYDPGDGQMSYLSALTFGNLTLERVLTAGVLRSPFNVRPLLGIRPHTSTKGMGYMAWGYLRRYRTHGDPADAAKAVHCLEWLLEHCATAEPGHCWGNDFTFTTRAGRIPRGAPTIVWSGLIGQAFIEAYLALRDDRWLAVAASVCDWILTLPRETTASGVCLSYVSQRQVSIHNSNLLGAALLAQVGALTGRQEALDVAREAIDYSCTRQQPDGAWFYGEASKYHWIDNFHTGYNLDSLKRYIDSSADTRYTPCLTRGYDYFKRNFFESDGAPKYLHDRSAPRDIQCAAQAIDTLASWSDDDPQAVPMASLVAHWTIANMMSPQGYFYYRDLGWTKIRTPMFHWGQATMFKALAHLVEAHRSRAP